MFPILPLIAGAAAGIGLVEATKRTFQWLKKTPVERAQCNLVEAEEAAVEAKKHLAKTEAAETKAAKAVKKTVKAKA